MKSLITALFVSASVVLVAQENVENLIGKWEYQDLYEKEKLDSTEIASLTSLFGEMSLQFDSDSLFKAVLMGDAEQGKWTTNNNNKVIVLTSNKGNIFELQIMELTDAQLTFEMNGNAIVMNKMMMDEEPIMIVDDLILFDAVPATKEQIAKKWYLKSMESFSDNPDEIKEDALASLEGAYLDIKSNGKYELYVLGIKETGKWEFGEDNKSIITSVDESKKLWNIVGISDSELTFIKGNTEEKWAFGTEE